MQVSLSSFSCAIHVYLRLTLFNFPGFNSMDEILITINKCNKNYFHLNGHYLKNMTFFFQTVHCHSKNIQQQII